MTTTLIIDMDALADLSQWENLAHAKQWDEFFAHIPDAPLRYTATAALARWASAHGARVVISSRWDERHRAAATAWLSAHNVPSNSLYMRRSANPDAPSLAHRHAITASKRRPGTPVLVVHNSGTVATALRSRDVRALPADRITDDPAMWARLITYAKPLTMKKKGN
ncbi:Uncharacterised protein [Mycobacteroides abscessus subsp. abscessus]|uniref:hypothetical protein n=1 Tax=Mycobacteroides abscessus TaxID=36809 RepID=UPI0009297D99|nr:hypothetical protein [Mycobacteroides abscessus]MDM2175307.1 hypothetical protein [Mycobacteroides abscessus]MDM2176307.1 hypothetical protein [Mycobacteroides abscessus]MDM2204872.1 hypothetical protein [Mycobacteroides abscessus]MDM2210457.1 hypothetical protein [Mycobacteroides abscessus]MDM2215791.1 hypothetical protein [Mycobacteroides abscessus]